MKFDVTVATLTVLSDVSLVTSFSFHQYRHQSFLNTNIKPIRNTSTLWAKTKKRTKKSTARGGGFGKTVSKSSKASKKAVPAENDDYASFPALEQSVKDTLVPSSLEDKQVGDLSQEIYDRLSQIYGFHNFNYEIDESTTSTIGSDEESLSFDDIFSTSSTPTTSSKNSLDFDQLVKKNSVSGIDASEFLPSGTTTTASKAVDTADPQPELNLSKLAPFSKFRVLHVDPMVLCIDDFFTEKECDDYINLSITPKSDSSDDMPMMSRSKTVGKDALAQAQRTSTTWFHHFKNVPELVAKASRLMGLDGIDRWEEPQTVRYRQSEKFTWHLDALSPANLGENSGGQRVATLLVYLSTIEEENGGATCFRDLGGSEDKYLKVAPKKGSALLFFPAAGNIPNCPFDIRTLHAGEALASSSGNDKWIAQLWLRQQTGYKPTAPPENVHQDASEVINEFCSQGDEQ